MRERIRSAGAYVNKVRETFLRRDFDVLSRLEYRLAWFTLLIVRTAQRFDDMRMTQRAAGLAFHTALSLIPVLVLVVAIVGSLGLLDRASDLLLDLLFDAYVPVDEAAIRPALERLIEGAGSAYLGTLGLLFFLYTAISLFNEADQLFNDAWDVDSRRPIFRRIVLFWTILTVAPPLLTGSMVLTTQAMVTLQTQVGTLGFLDWLVPNLTPFVLSTIALFAAIRLLPYCRVRFVPALIAAAVTALLFEITKLGFGFYVSQFASVSWFRIYGAVFLVPVMLLWIYLLWLIIAAGVVLAYCIQYFDELTFEKQPAWRRFSSGVGAIALLEPAVVLAQAFENGEGGLVTSEIASRAALSSRDTRRVLRILQRADVVSSHDTEAEATRWHLRRPASKVRLDDMLRAGGFFDSAVSVDSDAVIAPLRSDTPLSRLALTLRDELEQWTLEDLLQQVAEPEVDLADEPASVAEDPPEIVHQPRSSDEESS